MAAILDWLVGHAFVLEIAAYLFGVAALLIGGLTLLANRESSRRQEFVITKMEGDNLELERSLQEEKLAGRELLVMLAPRRLGYGSGMEDKHVDRLKTLAGRTAVVEFLPQIEPRRAADAIARTLESAGWKIIGPNPNDELWRQSFDGVRIEYNVNKAETGTSDSREDTIRRMEARSASSLAAAAVGKYLQKHKWKNLNWHGQSTDVLPFGAVKIKVGFKPEPRLPNKELDRVLARAGLAEDPDKPIPLERTEARKISAKQRTAFADMFLEVVEDFPEYRRPEILRPVIVRCPAGNDEALTYANELADMLRGVGLTIVGNDVKVDSEFPRRQEGVVLYNESPSNFFCRAVLIDCFNAIGLEFEKVLEYDPTDSDGPLQLLVGW